MALPFYTWSRTAGSNATADSTVNWAEGQAPASVNDSGRAMMASTAAYRDDVAGSITTGGTSTAYTVTSYQVFDTLAHMNGQMISFVPHATNGANVTLNVDGLGAKSIGIDNANGVPAGTLVAGTPYTVVYYSAGGGLFILKQFFQIPYVVPIGGMIDFTGPSVPNSNFVFPIGQAISRVTYSVYFGIVGTTYGIGDGSTTFNVIDVTGRVTAMKEASATRLTTAGSGVDGATLGATGGVQNVTLVAGQIPSLTSVNASQAISVRSTVTGVPSGANTGSLSTPNTGSVYHAGSTVAPLTVGQITSTDNNSISVAYTNGSQAITKTVQPTIICNKILRII